MKCLIVGLLLVLAISSPVLAQESWVMLYEYPSPGEGARELYYDGKLLWNVDNESQTVFTMDPYNLEVIDIYESPVDQPWGFTCDGHSYWMTNFGNPTSQLVKLRADTFLVDETYNFPGYYFYGLTYDSLGQHLWISAMNHSFEKFLLEFDGAAGQVVQWHSWPWTWNLGLQYWDSCLWVNTSDWGYPDYTYILNLDQWQVEETYTCPMSVPEGIATNGFIWWISHFRNNAPYIWKLIPPGTVVHDIAKYSSWFPPSGTIDSLLFQPQAKFINYGSVAEIDVPFTCRVKDDELQMEIYGCTVVYPSEIVPEEIVQIAFDLILLQPGRNYTFTFYSDLLLDDYRANDTLKVYVHTEGEVHDLAILSVLEPDSLEPVQPITTQIVVKNLGTVTEPVAPVDLEIAPPEGPITQFGGQAYNLQPNEIDTITFPTFVPAVTGEYVFTFDGQLPADINPGNDYRTLNCLVGIVHDVAPVEITSPGLYQPFGPITPSVVVANLGEFNENAFYTDCSVHDPQGQEIYWQHVICPPLNIGQPHTLSFPAFSPPEPAEYRFTFTTQLGTDNVPENDSLGTTSAVGLLWDVLPIAVLEPPAVFAPGAISPTVIISNIGTEPAGNFYSFCLVDSDSVAFYALPQWVATLDVGESDTLIFPALSLNQPGQYRFRFITDWVLDIVPENDTLEFWAELPLGIGDHRAEPVEDFRVEGCYPNPFNLQASFTVHLPVASAIVIELYNLSGEKVSHYNFGNQMPGIHSCVVYMNGLPSGLYLAKIDAGGMRTCKKMALLK